MGRTKRVIRSEECAQSFFSFWAGAEDGCEVKVKVKVSHALSLASHLTFFSRL